MKNIYISSCEKNGGIYRYSLENGKLVFADKTDIDRPMYSVFNDGKMWVLLRETDEKSHFGGIMSFDIGNDGKLCDPSEIKSTNGICPCHLSAGKNDVYFVNYLSGNVATLSGKTDTHSGIGVNLPRQDMPHTHFVGISPDGKYLLSCDLGLDCIYTYNFDLSVKCVVKVPSGHGARHLAYSECGKYVYCVNELMSSVCVFAYDDGVLTLRNTYSCIENSTKENYSAAIMMKNGHLYISNRGEDTVVCFKAVGDGLEFQSRTKTGGIYPWDINFANDFLICANHHSDNVTVFSVENGALTQTDNLTNLPKPICITVI